MPTGIVKFFKADKGYGFIKPDDGGPDIFVHIRDIRGQQQLQQGMRVGYEIATDQRSGRTKAQDVRLL